MLKLEGQNINQLLLHIIYGSFQKFYPDVAGFLKNVLKRQKKANSKRKDERRAF